MTQSQTITVTCPKCEQQGTAEIWTSINARDDPDGAQWLIDGFLFQYECPACGHVSALNHDCLFHDVRNSAMVLYVADPEKAEGAMAALEARRRDGYRLRLVASLEELREKAAIFRDGLDDRAVEVAKQAIFNRFVSTGEVEKGARVRYGATAEDGGVIVEFVSAQGTTETTVPPDVYQGIADSFTDVQPPVVDRFWAMNVLTNWS